MKKIILLKNNTYIFLLILTLFLSYTSDLEGKERPKVKQYLKPLLSMARESGITKPIAQLGMGWDISHWQVFLGTITCSIGAYTTGEGPGLIGSTQKGTAFKAGLLLNKNFEFYSSYVFEKTTIEEDPISGPSTSKEIKSDSLRLCLVGRTYLDNETHPQIWSEHKLSFKFSGIGVDTDYIKASLLTSWYFPIFKSTELNLKAELCTISGYKDFQDLPHSERAYITGGESVRGYMGLGPDERGTIVFITNLEYAFPIAIEKKITVLEGIVFADIGGVWKDSKEVNLTIGDEQNQLKIGNGFGLRFTIPSFPIRLYYGFPLNNYKYKENMEFYFFIGCFLSEKNRIW